MKETNRHEIISLGDQISLLTLAVETGEENLKALEAKLKQSEADRLEGQRMVSDFELQLQGLEEAENGLRKQNLDHVLEIKALRAKLEEAVNDRNKCEAQLMEVREEMICLKTTAAEEMAKTEWQLEENIKLHIDEQRKHEKALHELTFSFESKMTELRNLENKKLIGEQDLQVAKCRYHRLIQLFPDVARFNKAEQQFVRAAGKGDDYLIEKILQEHTQKFCRALAESREDRWPRNTPLILAAMHGHASTVSLLIERGAKLETQNDNGNTAIQIAAEHGQVESIKALLMAGANSNSILLRAVNKGQSKMVTFLLSRYASSLYQVTEEDEDKALEAAKASGNEQIIQILTSRGFK